MSKKLIIILFAIFTAVGANAQKFTPALPPELDIALMDRTWELIAKIDYKKVNGKNVLYFPPALQAMNNKPLELSGYMVPIKTGLTHDTFAFSVLPYAQCEFCGVGGVPNMIEVHLLKGIRATYDPLRIRGKFILKPPAGYGNPVFIVDAEVVE